MYRQIIAASDWPHLYLHSRYFCLALYIGMPFRKNLVGKFNPQKLLSYTQDLSHIKFNPVFDPNKDMMLGIERIFF